MKKYIKPKYVLIDLDAEELLAESDPTGLNGFEDGDGLAKRQNRIIIDDDEDEDEDENL